MLQMYESKNLGKRLKRFYLQNAVTTDIPLWSSGKDSAFNAGGMGLIPGLRTKITHISLIWPQTIF